MIDLFLSYARPDRDWVAKFAETMIADGWRVWWDRDIPLGASFQRAITDALEQARCVSVVWSNAALDSRWVLAEATIGLDREILVPVFKEHVRLPAPFNLIQSADLSDWRGDTANAVLASVRKKYCDMLGQPDYLPLAEGARLINQFVRLRRIEVSDIEEGIVSSTGAKAYRAAATDGKGTVYCHATGPYAEQVFYVRKGIAFFYHGQHGGPTGKLGLPVSNEELADGSGFPTSYFERGLIEWSPKTSEAQAYLMTPTGREAVGPSKRL